MILVISSPSSSTTGFLTLIFLIVDIFLDCRKIYPTAGLKVPEDDAAEAKGKVLVNLDRANGILPLYVSPAFREEAALRRTEEAAAAAAGEGLMVWCGVGAAALLAKAQNVH